MTWRLLENQSMDIYHNLAVDEALAKTYQRDENTLNTLRFWKSDRSVVIGRFQCVHKEVNLEYCKEHEIAIARRFTGGGSVFHDEGNLNYSIRLHQSHNYVPRGLKDLYESFIGTIIRGLCAINIPAKFDPVRSCIRIGEKKISGTAGWIKQGISFIHGTLLIDADLNNLRYSLNPPEGQPKYLRDKTRIRCMESKRDTVTNICHEVDSCPTRREIQDAIIEKFESFSGDTLEAGRLTQAERDTSQTLYQTRYKQPTWNLGTPTQE